MRRAALIEPHLLAVIVIALSAIVIFSFFSPLQAVVRKGTDIETCKLSVRAASTALIGNAITIKCPTQRILIKADGVYRSGVQGSASNKFMSTGDAARRLQAEGIKTPTKKQVALEMAQYAIAKEMATCWSEFGEGKLNPFKSRVLISDFHCVTCAVIDFDQSFKDAVGQNGIAAGETGFTNYLKTHKVDGTMTFYAYLRPKLTESRFDIAPEDLPVNADLIDAAYSPKVKATDYVQFDTTQVITLQKQDAAYLARWFTTAEGGQASVVMWPAEYRPYCDVLF